MRTHQQIIRDAGGYKVLASKIGQPESRVRFWDRRDSIPAPYWHAITDARLATIGELVAAKAAEAA